MCLVAYQKIFRKIFSGVWKRRKTQIQKNTSHNLDPVRRPRRRSRSEIAIDGVISRSVDRDLGSSSLAYIRDLAIDASRDRDLDPVRSRDGEIAINGDWNVCRRDRDRHGLELGVRRRSSDCAGSRARALSLSLCKIFRKYFEGKIEV